MFITPQNAYTQGDVLEGGAFEGWVGREGRALAQEIVANTKKRLESQVVPSMNQDSVRSPKSTDQKRAVAEPDHAGILSLDFQLQNHEKSSSLVDKAHSLAFCYSSPNRPGQGLKGNSNGLSTLWLQSWDPAQVF